MKKVFFFFIILAMNFNNIFSQGVTLESDGEVKAAGTTPGFLLYDSDGTTLLGEIRESTNNICVESELGKLFLQTTDVTRMAITEDGNIGIGTSAPDEKFVIVNGSNITKFDGEAMLFGEPGGVRSSISNNFPSTGDMGVLANQRLFFTNGNLQGFHIDLDNNVNFDPSINVGMGLGSSLPTSKLHVKGNSEAGPGIRIEIGNILNNSDTRPGVYMRKIDGSFAGAVYGDVANETTGTGEGIDLKIEADDDINFTTGDNPSISKMFITHNGNVGMGTASPGSFKLKIAHGNLGLNLDNNGNDWEIWSSSATNGALFLYPNEEASVGNFNAMSGTYSATSDARLKSNIRNLESILEKVNQLKPSRYNYRKDKIKKREFIGFIAQDVEELFPELVFIGEDARNKGQYSLDYSGFGILAIKAIQEQQQLIENLQTENQTVKEEKEKLEAKVSDLETKVEELYSLIERITTLETNLQSCCLQHHNTNTSHLEENSSSISDFHTEIPQLQQNFPNPFNQQTEIQYYLPTSAQSAELHITDLSGKTLKTYTLSRNGIGKVMLNGGELAAGTYAYTLVVDGQIVDTKQMILTK